VDTSYYKISKEEKNDTVDQLKSNVQTNNRSEVLNNLNGTLDSNGVDISPKLNGANINQLLCNNQHSKERRPVNDSDALNERDYNSCYLPSQLPKLLEPVKGPKQ
jgi:hypothetical protein